MKIIHVGIVVKKINEYLSNNVITDCTEITYDPIQNADICFLKYQNSPIGIELIEPKTKNSTVYNFLNKQGGGLHHLCYEARSINQVTKMINEKNMLLVYGPVEAVALNNHQVVFAYTRSRELIEFEIVDNDY